MTSRERRKYAREWIERGRNDLALAYLRRPLKPVSVLVAERMVRDFIRSGLKSTPLNVSPYDFEPVPADHVKAVRTVLRKVNSRYPWAIHNLLSTDLDKLELVDIDGTLYLRHRPKPVQYIERRGNTLVASRMEVGA